MKCNKCGFENNNGSRFCSSCGAPLIVNQQQPNQPYGFQQQYQQQPNQPYGFQQQYQQQPNQPYSSQQFQTLPYQPPQQPVKKKKKMGCLTVGLIVLGIFVFLGIIGALVDSDDVSQNGETTSISESTTKKEKTTKKETTTKKEEKTTKKEDAKSKLEKQFKGIGLTQKEASEFAKIFNKIGIKEINNIEAITGTGIDNLQAFRCKLYDYDTLQVNFTVESRTLCYVEIAGLPSTKTDFYIGMFGKLKTKQVQTTTSVTMYDKWDSNGDIDNNKNPYLAVFDYDNQKISEYKK